jgi:hypothetical protein
LLGEALRDQPLPPAVQSLLNIVPKPRGANIEPRWFGQLAIQPRCTLDIDLWL